MDFLLTKPRERGCLFFEKLLAALCLLVASNFFFILESLILYRVYAPAPLMFGRALLAASSLLWMELLFLSVGAVIAVFARRVRSVSGLATAIGFAGFLLSALHSLLELEDLRYITPFSYYDTAKAFFDGTYEPKYALVGAAVTLALMVAAYARYTRADIPAQGRERVHFQKFEMAAKNGRKPCDVGVYVEHAGIIMAKNADPRISDGFLRVERLYPFRYLAPRLVVVEPARNNVIFYS